ncbi:hypothetical protein GCM10023196_098690 [Actinoallomurus vinaceus]|uniref:Uncharacterized protein n=1 Tax=Actinoallomurus vinaceus TaxID=1080074 RepID=A0ABP8UTG0_9ACTN
MAIGEVQSTLHLDLRGDQIGKDRLGEIELAGPRGVQVRCVLEIAGPQPDGMRDDRIPQVQRTGDAGADDPQRRYLASPGPLAEKQRTKNPGTNGPFGPQDAPSTGSSSQSRKSTSSPRGKAR